MTATKQGDRLAQLAALAARTDDLVRDVVDRGGTNRPEHKTPTNKRPIKPAPQARATEQTIKPAPQAPRSEQTTKPTPQAPRSEQTTKPTPQAPRSEQTTKPAPGILAPLPVAPEATIELAARPVSDSFKRSDLVTDPATPHARTSTKPVSPAPVSADSHQARETSRPFAVATPPAARYHGGPQPVPFRTRKEPVGLAGSPQQQRLVIAVVIGIFALAGLVAAYRHRSSTPVVQPQSATDGEIIVADDSPTEMPDVEDFVSPLPADLESSTSDASIIADNAWELVGSEPGTALLSEIIDRELLRAALDGEGDPIPFTFLSPTDKALGQLGQERLAVLANDPDSARAFLDAHIVEVRLTEMALREQTGSALTTRAGTRLIVGADFDHVTIGGDAVALFPLLEAADGSVLVIDSALED